MTADGIATVPSAYVVLIAYWTILGAELAGDKSTYTVASLGLRFPPGVVFGAMALAFAGKMLGAVMLGHLLVRISSRGASLLSAATFFVSAAVLWLRRAETPALERPLRGPSLRLTAACFAPLFLTEWGDPGQISAAALTAQARSTWAPWLGGTLALMTKGSLALGLGVSLRGRLPLRAVRVVASLSCAVLGMLALGSALLR